MSSCLEHVSPLLHDFVVDYNDFKLIKSIGHGGSGKVYLATHVPSGKTCSFKKLFIKELKDKNLISFCREVEALVKCDNVFVLPFYGWVPNYPYSIITEYVPNGSLYHAIRSESKTPILSPTNKTLIAIGIANGMMSLHKLGIIHRDLKSLNILLDENLLPKIGDFGLSRIQGEEQKHMTADIGTPHWMAPELFESNIYTNKVDVYSYGMILWEIVTGAVPFNDFTPIQIALRVSKEQLRPEIPSDTPKALQSLIKRCWSQKPEDRPTFSQIYKFLIRKRAFFNGTDLKAIDQLATEIKRQEKIRLCQSNNRIAPFSTFNNSHKQNQNNDIISPFTDLPHPNLSTFKSCFTDCLNYFTNNTYDYFDDLFHRLLSIKDIHEESLELILNEVSKLLSAKSYLTHFIDKEIYKQLPFNDRDITCLSLQILLRITTERPSVVDLNLLNLLMPSLSTFPSKILRIISPFFISFDQMKNNLDVCDFLIKHPDIFLADSGPEYLNTFYYLCITSNLFLKMRFNYVINILCFGIMSSDIDTIIADYSFICQFFDERITLPIRIVTDHLLNNEIREYALSYLVRKAHIELTTDLVSNLLTVSPLSSLAFHLLCKYLSKSTQTQQFLLENESWLDKRSLPISIPLKIALIIGLNPNLRMQISENKKFIILLNRIVKSKNLEYLSAGCKLITKMMPNTIFIGRLNNWFLELFAVINKLNQEKFSFIRRDLLEMILACSQFFYVSEFLSFVPILVSLLAVPDEVDTTLSALIELSQYPKSHSTLKKCNLEKSLAKIENNYELKVKIEKIHQNLLA